MRLIVPLALFLTGANLSAAAAPPEPNEVRQAMHRATDFMFDTLSNQGGFVWFYTTDLEPYGELRARPSMVWVEPPGTPSVGLVLLEAWKATGDAYYLQRAGEVAEALAKGQHPSGGWNYFIDFDPEGLPDYYEAFFSRCWGWQEYLKQRDNATFDDYSTTEATRFFLRLFDATKAPEHKAVLDKALAFILRAQYPDGGWPQRFPHPEADQDYTAARTFNDDVAYDCIQVLLEAHDQLGDHRYRAAAIRGMDFYILAQLPAPQAGWAQQYDSELDPVWGRPFEIGTLSTTQTVTNINQLLEFYGITGDRRYLMPIPEALEWLASARLPEAEGYTHTGFYERKTNRPMYIKQTGTTVDDVRYTPTYEKDGCYPYSHEVSIDIDGLRANYRRWASKSAIEARAAYRESRYGLPLPEDIKGGHLAVALNRVPQTDAGVADIVSTLDERGGWQDEVAQLHPFQPFTEPPQRMKAYIVGGYIARMYRMINYLNQTRLTQ